MSLDMMEVRSAFIQIDALDEEIDGYKKEIKRCKEDRDAIYLILKKKATSNQEEIGFAVPTRLPVGDRD